MPWTWRTLPDGRVEVTKNGAATIPTRSGADAHTERAETFGALARAAARRERVPLAWVLGVMVQESGGNPDAVSPVGARGLMQIMPSTAALYGVPASALSDPKTNIDLGAKILGRFRDAGYDLPSSASKYNAGQTKAGTPWPSAKSPWGMRENTGYISAVVENANWYFSRRSRSSAAPLLFAAMLGAAAWNLR